MKGVRTSLALSAALLVLALPALARRQAPSPLDELNRLQGSLPASVNALVTVRNAAGARHTPAARSLDAMLRESARLADTERAWRALATHLGWTPEQAFDELLGRHVTFVSAGIDATGAKDWALLGEVTRQAEARLRIALRPAPRSIVRGLTVLAVEDGAFELTIRNRALGSALTGEEEADTSTSSFMLAPAGSAHLFDEILPVIGADAPAEGRGLLERGATRTTAFAMIRRPGVAPGDRRPVLAFTAALDPGSSQSAFHVRLLVSDAFDVVPPVSRWSDASARRLESGTILATVGVAGLSPFEAAAEALGLSVITPAARSLDPMPDRRIALIVREQEAAPPLPPAPQDGPVVAWDPARKPVGVALPQTRHPLSVTLAVELPDLHRTIPRTDALASILDPVLRGDDPPEPAPLVEIDTGISDLAVRSAPLEGAAAESWRPVIGPEPMLRWGYARTPGREDAGPDSPDPGWWVVGLEPGDAQTREVEQVRTALSLDRPDPRARRHVSVGSIRPRLLERWLVAMDPALATVVGPLGWIDSARWETWLTPFGAIEGEVTIRMHTPAPR